MPNLIIIYGPPLSGKTTAAWELGRSLPEKTAIVSTDSLLTGSIAVPDADATAELEMAHVQLRLMVANYLKNGYHVVVEGPFLFERGGNLYNYEADIDQLIALMRHLTDRAVVVRLTASEPILSERASRLGREAELASALRIAAAFKSRYGVRFYTFDTGVSSPEEIVVGIKNAISKPEED